MSHRPIQTYKQSAWASVSAPGKLFLAGEYGVLFGGPALVMAVNRRLTVGPGGDVPASADPLIRAVLEEVSHIASLPKLGPRIEEGAFYDAGGLKLGLGSSAAKAAALTASVFVMAGRNIDDEDVRREVLDVALAGHGAAGGGSGADVAASVLGGAVRFKLVGKPAGSLVSPSSRATSQISQEATPVEIAPPNLPIIVRGGSPVSTRTALEHLGKALEEGSRNHRVLIEEARDAGRHLVEALTNRSCCDGDVISAVSRASKVLQALGEILQLGEGAGLGALRSANEVATSFGGAAKPSGAGGGDLILVFAPSVPLDERPSVVHKLDKAGLNVLNVAQTREGVCLHEPLPPAMPQD